MNKNENGWSLLPNDKGLYILTLSSEEGEEKLWVSEEELRKLKLFLITLEIPLPENELPL